MARLKPCPDERYSSFRFFFAIVSAVTLLKSGFLAALRDDNFLDMGMLLVDTARPRVLTWIVEAWPYVLRGRL